MSNFLRCYELYSPWNSPGQDTGVGSLPLFQGIFPTQGSNPDLPHLRRILYQLSHKESPRTLEWVAYPSPADLLHPGTEPGFPVSQADSLPTKLSGTPVTAYNFFSEWILWLKSKALLEYFSVSIKYFSNLIFTKCMV